MLNNDKNSILHQKKIIEIKKSEKDKLINCIELFKEIYGSIIHLFTLELFKQKYYLLLNI